MKRNKLLLTALILAIPTLNGCSLLEGIDLGILDPLHIFTPEEENPSGDNTGGDDSGDDDEGGGQVTPKPHIEFSGDLVKKTYNFTDQWDLTGLSVKAFDESGNSSILDESKYTMTVTPATPSAFVGTLQVKVTATGYLYITKNFSDIKVGQEQYDFSSEVSSYYSDLSAQTLKGLQQHSFNKHTTWINYGDVKNYYAVKDGHRSIDEIPGKYKNEGFYNGREMTLGGNGVEKEHVWACANTKYSGGQLYVHGGEGNAAENNVDNTSYVGAGSDLLHIRPCVGAVNKARGNCVFTELGSKGTNVQDNGDPYTFKVYSYKIEDGKPAYAAYGEPDNNMKGDLVRTIAYVYMHYGEHGGYPSNKSSKCGPISLNSVFSISGTSYSSVKELMIAWNNLDPVSEVEKYRNHTVEKIQGNRNPFVDHPEWISSLL